MVSLESARSFALSLDEVVEGPHHDVVSFKVKSKIFMTMNAKENRICIRLSPVDQSVFSAFDSSVIFPVPNGWGKYGWTLINLKKVKKEMLKDAVTTAYCHVAPPKLAAKYLEF
jgi:hypothetical protein